MSKGTLLFDASKCVGCYACAVACMDQNDIDVALEPLYRHIVHVERNDGGAVQITHVSMACQHCEGAECLDACPSGALRRDAATEAVIVREGLCIGCHACSMACPFGVPRFDRDGVMRKCDGCYARTSFGYAPACVDVCPTSALCYGDANDVSAAKQKRYAETLI